MILLAVISFFFLIAASFRFPAPLGIIHTDYTMIHEFVDKIVVHEADKSTGERIQQIDVYLKYVGKLNVPMPEPTPEEREAERRKLHKRAWNCTYMRRKYAKEKAEREAKTLERTAE